MTSCRVCGSALLSSFLQRQGVPIHQNLVVQTAESAKGIERGDLDMVVCNECGFVFNRAFDQAKVMYGNAYNNAQCYSSVFSGYVDGLVRELVEVHGVRNCTIVEVGCGKGEFLRRLVEYPGSGNRGIGFDPSYVGPESDLDGRLRFERRYYDEECANVPADVVVCRHVIEHVPQPMELLGSVRSALKTSSNAQVFFETPCVEWILRNIVIWDFFYEHCSLFSEASIATAFEAAGFNVEFVRHTFGSQYLWLKAVPAVLANGVQPRDSGVPRLAREFAEASADKLASWSRELDQLRQAGGIALWGAGAKGVTVANLLDPDATRIRCVVDINPDKQGRYIPGTAHPIVTFQSLPSLGVQRAVLTNPNYRTECEALLAQVGIDVTLIEWS